MHTVNEINDLTRSEKIKIALRRRGKTLNAVADHTGYSRQYCHLVAIGDRKNKHINRIFSELLESVGLE